ncbi:MAG: hypothetical protein K6F32_00420 [Bacilli bacterium]|nr:hypothetical protein [Bacilli bacterium]
MEQEKKLVLDVHESPKRIRDWVILSVQHILAMFVACITVPLIVYSGYLNAAGESLAQTMIPPVLVSAGVGTIFYLIVTKMKSPVFLASSFAYIAPISGALAIGAVGTTPNLWALPIGMGMVGIIYVVIALLIRAFGVNWLMKLLPPIVIGPVIMVIGLSLAASAINNLTNVNGGAENYNLIHILCGLVALVVTALCAHYGKKTVALIPFVLGMCAGYLTALAFTLFGYYLGENDYFHVIDFSPLVNNFSEVTFRSFIDYPDFLFLTQKTVPLKGEMIGTIALLFIPVSLVTICEHIGDHENLSGILDRNLLEDPGLSRTLIGDGVATALSGVMSGVANTTYGENVAVVGVTKIASTKVVLTAAIGAILLAFIKPLMCLVMTIPACVTGGVSLILYGFIASSGVKTLMRAKVDFGQTKNIFVASVILVSGIGGLALKFGDPTNPLITVTSVAVSMILGILMNLILKDKKPAENQQ